MEVNINTYTYIIFLLNQQKRSIYFRLVSISVHILYAYMSNFTYQLLAELIRKMHKCDVVYGDKASLMETVNKETVQQIN